MDLNTRIFCSFFLEESSLPAGRTGSTVFTLSSRLLCAARRSMPVLVWSAGSGCLPGCKVLIPVCQASRAAALRRICLAAPCFGVRLRRCRTVSTLWPLTSRAGGDAALGCRAALPACLCMGVTPVHARGPHEGREHRALLADVKPKLEMRFLASYQCLLLCSREGYRGAKDNPAGKQELQLISRWYLPLWHKEAVIKAAHSPKLSGFYHWVMQYILPCFST